MTTALTACWRKFVKRRSTHERSDTGASLVEMAILLSLLVLMVLGVADFGRMLYHAITLSHAARAGAAHGAQNSGFAADTAGIQQAAEAEAQNIAPIAVTSDRLCECTGSAPVSCTTPSCGSYGAPRAFVEVTATHTFDTIATFPGLPSTVPLSRTAKMRVQ